MYSKGGKNLRKTKQNDGVPVTHYAVLGFVEWVKSCDESLLFVDESVL
jgi:hypothetical protein